MNKRLYTVLALLALTLLVSTACITINFTGSGTRTRGSGNLTVQRRPVSDFKRVSLSGIGELTITVGDEESLEIEAEDNLIDLIESEVRGGTLYLGFKDSVGNIQPTEKIHYRLTVVELVGAETSGTGRIVIGDLETDDLAVESSGTGNIEIESLQADTLAVHLSGTGKCEVGEGRVDRLKIDISGAGSFDAPNLESQVVDIQISGAGNAEVWATELLDVVVSGAGSVRYYGQPQVSQDVSGAGSVKSLGDK